jgi:formate hydrogenlyase subunit 3/multisubunit Na+/H+ antiporter MnhD subunit
MDLLLVALAIQFGASLLALLLTRYPRESTIFGAGGAVVAAVLGVVPAFRALLGEPLDIIKLPWGKLQGAFHIEADPLSGFFLVPVFVLSGFTAVYGAAYLYGSRHERSLGIPWFFFNVFVAGMVLTLLARSVFLFVMAWEIMSLAAFFLVTLEHEREEVRKAGWFYLVAAHLGVAFLLAAFLLLGRIAHGLDFNAFLTLELPPVIAVAVFVLALIGFGTKAGLVPFHVWLPEAHPAAPSHVSALMSGVMIKMGLYGFLRIITFLGPPASWLGLTLAIMGLLTAIVGIALAGQQRDMKRVLAYSSIENIGLIVLALGIGFWGQTTHRPDVAALGMTAALLHTWNHALMKGLLFLAAGSVLHGTGTKDMERLGGVLRRMPWTGTAFIIGAVAIAALPPLNGFTGKWLLYLGLIQGGKEQGHGLGIAAFLAVGLLALVGGLAVIAFVRLCGIVLLGSPRTEASSDAHESSRWMLVPMAALMLLCVLMATGPALVVSAQSEVLRQMHIRDETAKTSLAVLGFVNLITLAVVALAGTGLVLILRRRQTNGGSTWGCGYAQPTPRIQYTGRSFAQMLGDHLLPRLLRPRRHRKTPEGLFPPAGEFSAESPDPISDKVYLPFFARWARRFAWLRILQQGQVHIYLFYIVVTVVLALTWISLRGWWGVS